MYKKLKLNKEYEQVEIHTLIVYLISMRGEHKKQKDITGNELKNTFFFCEEIINFTKS